MKGFRVCNNDLENWVEVEIEHACDVVDFLKENPLRFSEKFEIEWKTPLNGEYRTIVVYENYCISFNTNFHIPSVFKNLF